MSNCDYTRIHIFMYTAVALELCTTHSNEPWEVPNRID